MEDDDADDYDDDDDDERTIVCSPSTRICYDISSLDHDTQSEIRHLFRKTPSSDPPQVVLEWCQFNQDQQDGQFYAFQLHEVVPRSIRIGSPNSRYHRPRCNCMGEHDKPCKHLVYLMDQLKYFSADQLINESIQEIGPDHKPTEYWDAFEMMSSYHIDLLASNLHCDVGSPESKTGTNRVHLAETREILAAIAEPEADDLAVQNYRPDIFQHQHSILEENGIVSHSDLAHTVANMLITNNDFFAYFLSLLGPTSQARDPYRKIQQHIDRVLSELAAYFRSPSRPLATTAEGPRDVPGATRHLSRAVSTIRYLLHHRSDAPSPSQPSSAARTLVRILRAVIFDWNRDVTVSTPTGSGNYRAPVVARNLYHNLIGAHTHSPTPFVLDTLAQLPEQNQWIETLEDIESRLGEYSPPAEYMRRLRDLIELMRSSSQPVAVVVAAAAADVVAAGSKRRSGEGDGRERAPKRAR